MQTYIILQSTLFRPDDDAGDCGINWSLRANIYFDAENAKFGIGH
jgi:hypothetical protein